MSRIRARVERLERRWVDPRSLPYAVHVARLRLEARQELLFQAAYHACETELARYTRERGEEPDPIAIDADTARRWRRARQLLGKDDADRHRRDQSEVLRWERITLRRPGEYARQWRGDWQRRRLEEILEEIAAEFGLQESDRRSASSDPSGW